MANDNGRIRVYSDDLGWQRQRTAEGIVHSGTYRGPAVRYSGWILEDNDTLAFYIYKPPINLLRDTEYGQCFHPQKDGDWWLIGFRPYARPADVSSGIAAIQKALRTAFTTRLRSRRTQR